MPDVYIRYRYPELLDESRAALGRLLSTNPDTLVLVPNASTGVNTILRNIEWNSDAKDEILWFSTIYGGCGNTIDYVVDSQRGLVSSREIILQYPIEDDEIVSRFKEAVKASTEASKRPRICVFDVVSSLPGVRFPFERMAEACRELGVLSLIDGAQGIGMIPIDLSIVDPDFFVSNCHKWLMTPRGCAVLYVPVRNQHMMLSTLPTSHGYIAKVPRLNPLPPNKKPQFVRNFEFVGTVDNSPYVCVTDSIKWRDEVLGGEARITDYLQALVKEGGRKAAKILGTRVLDNETGTLTNCGMVNVALPMIMVPDEEIGQQHLNSADVVVRRSQAYAITQWILETLMEDFKTFIALFAIDGRWWARLSAQVYLEVDDFEWAARTLKTMCERVRTRVGEQSASE